MGKARLVLLAFVLSSCATPTIFRRDTPRGPSSDPGISATADAAVDSLANILLAHTQVLDREMVTFHYEEDDIHPHSLTDIQDRIRPRPGRFFDANILEPNAIGPGTYVSIANDENESGLRRWTL